MLWGFFPSVGIVHQGCTHPITSYFHCCRTTRLLNGNANALPCDHFLSSSPFDNLLFPLLRAAAYFTLPFHSVQKNHQSPTV